jgi:ubiquinol-cytochrome c reductase iron-sulfur subunit
MSDDKQVNKSRRNLVIACGAAGGVAGVAAAVPFAASWLPSDRARAGGPEATSANLNRADHDLEWLNMDRSPHQNARQPGIDASSRPRLDVPMQPDYAKNEFRSIKPEVLVLVGICSHLGCSPQSKPAEAKAEMGADWAGGFLCPCHGSKFDLAGRVYKGAPAPVNLEVPQHTYLSDTRILIGEDKKGA